MQHGLAGEQSPADPIHSAVERPAHVVCYDIVQLGQEPLSVDIGQLRVVRRMIESSQHREVNLARMQEQQAPDERSRIGREPCGG